MKNFVSVKNASKDKNIYGLDVISLVVSIYGTNSKIYNSMIKGKKISRQVAFSMFVEKSRGQIDDRKTLLLKLCQLKEKQVERVL